MRPEAVGMAGGEDRVHPFLGQGPGRPVGPGTPVLETWLALGLEPAQPLPGRLAAHSGHVGGVSHGHPVDDDPLDQEPSAEQGQFRPTMRHESLLFDVSWLPTPNAGRLSPVNNLFVNHI